ncbi:polyketide synthase [Colletotrichum truncatum]|uniref:Polyketide synthase n=1 Tax=Colletotrichum truncatum TaxID=5467 RepID=A0ACC3Z371_COLTU|nr:polyketide synthase [Colletotrichum truncatum]KAF6793175.1 polyketide synthase [Colletotrichum truncatum]
MANSSGTIGIGCQQEDNNSALAIVGYAYRAPDVGRSGLWDLLADAKCASSQVPPSRFNQDAYYCPDYQKPGYIHAQGGHFMPQDIHAFDAAFFNIRRDEAKAMDPQQRITIECAFEAFENAGWGLQDVAGRNIAVFAAHQGSTYAGHAAEDLLTTSAYSASGTAGCMLANRISYLFDLRGPSAAIDTACASSSYAFHLACQSIRLGECSAALVSAANLLNGPELWSMLDTVGVLSSEGKCFSYDHRASGFGRGEGSACLVVKPLAAALADGDAIRAIIRNTAASHSGRITGGITMPSQEAQEELARRVHREVGLDPKDTGFVEGHGTGTAVGDPIDAAAIASVYGSPRSTVDPVYLGSIKSNIGHLEGASGLLSIIKAALMLERGVMLPNANFEKLNPAIMAASGADKLRVLKETMPWPMSSTPRRVCVTNYGLGGANSAILLEQPPNDDRINLKSDEQVNGQDQLNATSQVFAVSAGSISSLSVYVTSLAQYLASDQAHNVPNLLRDISFTLGQRRTHFRQSRRAVVAQSLDDLRNRLLEISGVSERSNGTHLKGSVPVPVLIFTGQGAQHASMITGLRRYPQFVDALARASQCLKRLEAPWSIEDELDRLEGDSRVNDAEISQPACTVVQIALVLLLRAWGVVPTAVAGHSSGEIAAAFAAGLISFETAVAVAYYRGQVAAQIMRNTALRGAMVAISIGEEDAEKLITETLGPDGHDKVTVAAVNSPASVTISGDEEAVNSVQQAAEQQGLNPRRLKVSVAYHSHHMQTVAESYKALIEPYCRPDPDLGSGLEKAGPDALQTRATFVSSVTGQVEMSLDASYWVRNLVQPVRFSEALERLLSFQHGEQDKNSNVLIEVGPHSALRGPIRQVLDSLRSNSNQAHAGGRSTTGPQQASYLASLQRGTCPVLAILNLASRLFEMGLDLNFEEINQTSVARLITDLPAYAWNHETTYLHRPRIAKQKLLGGTPYNALLGGRTAYCEGEEHSFRNVFTIDDMPWLRDHVVGGDVLFPFTGFLALALEAVRTVTTFIASGSTPESMKIQDLVVRRSLKLVEDQPVDVTTKLKPSGVGSETSAKSSPSWNFEILSWSDENGWTLHCRGCIAATEPLSSESFVVSETLEAIEHSMNSGPGLRRIDPVKEYRTAAGSGTAYGPSFATMTELWESPNHDVTTHVNILRSGALNPPSTFLPLSPVTVDPPTLDSFFHGIHILHERADGVRGVYVPTNVSRLRVSNRIQAEPGQKFTVVSRVLEHSRQNGRMEFSIVVFLGSLQDPGPKVPVLEIDRATVKRVRQPTIESIMSSFPTTYIERLVPHIDLVDGGELAKILTDYSLEHDQLEKRRLGNQVACGYMALALPETAQDDLSNLPSHLVKLRAAVQKFVNTWPGPSLPEEMGELSLATLRPLADAIGPAGTLLRIIGEKLVPIMRNEVQSLELMMQDGLLWQHYQDEAAFRRGNQAMAKYARTLATTTSNLRILEVGGGTAGTTKPVLEALSSQEVFPFAEYVFTDISSGFFEAGREKLEKWSDRMTFEKLDISKDPAAQGSAFSAGSFDLVIASLVLHATPDIAVTLSHVRSLLKPGGRLLMLESMHMAPLDLAYLGLPGWWLAEDAYRASGEPLVGQDVWDRALKDSGFTGIDGAVEDYPDHPDRNVTAIWSTVAGSCSSASTSTEDGDVFQRPAQVTICGFWDDENEAEARGFAQRVSREVLRRLKCESLPSVKEFSDFEVDPAVYCIFVDGHHRSIFDNISPSRFEKLKRLLLDSAGILWVSSKHAPPEAGLSKGLLRSLRHEDPAKMKVLLEGSVFTDGDDQGRSAKAVARIAQQLVTDEDSARLRHDQDLVLKNGQVHVSRLSEKEEGRDVFAEEQGVAIAKEEQMIPQDEAVEMTISSTGDIDAIYFQRTSLLSTEPEDDEIIVKVQAASLNFRDVLILLGSIPWYAPGREGAGEVVQVGAKVQSVKAGDRVFFYTTDKASSFANFVRVPHWYATKVPSFLSVEEAASLPTAYYTAIACLETLGRLQEGETLLIHSAAGAVGQVCIQLAQHIGARIFATAGTPERRDYLRQSYHLTEVFDSRTTEFREQILRATKGKGVDVIVNSLSGNLLQATWDVVADYGRFVEIGRIDFIANSQLAMRPFDRNATFMGLDISRRPMSERRRVMDRIVELLKQGVFKPLHPLTLVPISQIQKALRKLQLGQIIGKAVVTVSESDMVLAERPRRLASTTIWLSSAATYLITGGTGGIGRSLSAWLLQNGAGHVVLLGRSGASQPKVAKLLEMYPGRLHAVACDVGQRSDLVRALEEIKSEGLPSVRGVIHGALYLRDALFNNTTFEDWQKITGPKVAATWSLHELLPGLDFFISLSSMTGVFGTLGQPAYCAASAFLNSFARYRLARGLPASSICLPLVEDIGYVAESLGNEDEWRRSLGLTLKEEHIFSLVKSAIVAPSALYDNGVGLSFCFTAQDVEGSQFPWMNQNYSMAVRNGIAGSGGSSGTCQLETTKKPGDKARRVLPSQDVLENLTQKVADITMMDLEELHSTSKLEDLGLDSLVAVELRNFIRREWAVELGLNQIVGGGSLGSLAEAIQSSQAEFAG